MTWRLLPMGRRIGVEFPYSQNSVNAIKTIPDRKWHAKAKLWSIPEVEINRLIKFLDSRKIPYIVDKAIKEQAKKRSAKEEALIHLKFEKETKLNDIPHFLLKPHPYQDVGIRFLLSAEGAILGDDLG